jgi:hypothetical protein
VDGVLVIALAVLAWLFYEGSRAGSVVGSGANELADYEGNAEIDAGDSMQGGTSKIANAIAKFEGFFTPGTLPNRTNNPGDIGTWGGKVKSYPSPEAGFASLDSYITSKATANPSWDFYDFFHYYLTGDPMGTPGPNQNPDGYAEYVAQQVGVDPTTPISQVIG